MLLSLMYRLATEVSPRLLWKAWRLWVRPGLRAMERFRRREAQGQLFPPFLFLALTDACNLRCRGCWIDNPGRPRALSPEQVDSILAAAKAQGNRFFTLLGGEPLLYPTWWQILQRHPDCYFQIITNGLLLDRTNVERMRRSGNVSPLVSIDGREASNDGRRGQGVFRAAMEALDRLRQQRLLFGVATTVTSENFEEVTSDAYVRMFIERGAMYLWYYVYRPMGPDPSPRFCLSGPQMLELRRRLLRLRRKHPIVLIDTYWDAEGRAVCPAARGLGFHIGPAGSIEPCPPLSFACDTIDHHDGDLFRTINQSAFLRGFQQFAAQRTCGCVILEHPQALAEFLRHSGACDYSGRDALAELEAAAARPSHDLPGPLLPEDSWFYRMLKRQLFFGMGAYG